MGHAHRLGEEPHHRGHDAPGQSECLDRGEESGPEPSREWVETAAAKLQIAIDTASRETLQAKSTLHL